MNDPSKPSTSLRNSDWIRGELAENERVCAAIRNRIEELKAVPKPNLKPDQEQAIAVRVDEALELLHLLEHPAEQTEQLADALEEHERWWQLFTTAQLPYSAGGKMRVGESEYKTSAEHSVDHADQMIAAAKKAGRL